MSDENLRAKSDEENYGEQEEEAGELFEPEEDIEDEKQEIDDSEFHGEAHFQEWDVGGEYGEGGYFIYQVGEEAAEYPSVWGEKESSIASEVSVPVSEVEETEEEKELRRERELLVDSVRQKLMDRQLLRRRNAFLQKKLVEHFKKRRMEHVLKEESKGLDLESKYLKRLFVFQDFKQAQETEIAELQAAMEQYESDTNVLEEELQEKLKSSVARAKEVSLNLISSKTGKRINEKTVDRLLSRQVKKNEEKGRKKLLYIKIKNLIEEKERLLKAMEYFGDGLHVVDYEQMKIDNQNYTDKIEEKEDELTKMRLKTQGIIQNIAHVREKTYAIEGDIELMAEKVYEVEKAFSQSRERLTKARKKRDSLRQEFRKLKSVSGLLTKDRLLRDFENSIFDAKNLTKKLENMKKVLSVKKRQESELAKVGMGSSTLDLTELRVTSRSKFKF